MLISDLKKTCEPCSGSGFKAGQKEWIGIQTNLRKSCPICFGRGFNFTELGNNIWELYLPKLRELIQEEIKKNSVFNIQYNRLNSKNRFL